MSAPREFKTEAKVPLLHLALALAGLALGYTAWFLTRQDGTPTKTFEWVLLTALFGSVFVGFGWNALRTAATYTVEEAGITKRTWLKTQTLSWNDVVALEEEQVDVWLHGAFKPAGRVLDRGNCADVVARDGHTLRIFTEGVDFDALREQIRIRLPEQGSTP